MSEQKGRWPKRYTMMGLMLSAMLLCHIDRVLMSLAAIEIQKEFSWSDGQKGLVLSTFFIGYLIMQAAGGVLANRFGGRNVFVISVFLWSLFTLLTPPAVYISFTALLIARFMLGFGEGGAYPSAYNLVHGWMPLKERSRAIGMISAFGALGTVFALLVVGKVIEDYGWESVFHIFGLLGLIWSVFGLWLIPKNGPLDELPSSGRTTKPKVKIPWRIIITTPAILVLFLVNITGSSVAFMMATWMPSYFVDTFSVSTSEAGIYSILPWVSLFIFTIAGGFYVDKKINSGCDVLGTRKRMVTLGYCLCLLSILGLFYATYILVAVLMITTLFAGVAVLIPAYSPMASEVLPKHGDILYGFMSAIGSLGSALYVALTGFLLDSTGSYSTIFMLMSINCIVGLFAFHLFAQSKPVAGAVD